MSLVGAGPGDPGMLTLQAAAELAAADVVISDKDTKQPSFAELPEHFTWEGK